jgi:O-acetyl-ADP-ribose deacetylase (regulator of RNase III)
MHICSTKSYFPRGGPVPPSPPHGMHQDWQPLGYVSSWGGMEVGTGMLYSVSVVDGLVHQLGGWTLRAQCAWHRTTATKDTDACPIGQAVVTSAGKEALSNHFDWIVHTTPPFCQHDPHPHESLQQCYQSAFQQVNGLWYQQSSSTDGASVIRVGVPLLGSGARGFPHGEAMEVAAQAASEWLYHQYGATESVESPKYAIDQHQTVAFGFLEQDWAEQFIQTMEQQVSLLGEEL